MKKEKISKIKPKKSKNYNPKDARIPSKSLSLHSIFDQKQCRDLLEQVKNEKFATVMSFKMTDGTKSPPLPLNTLNLLFFMIIGLKHKINKFIEFFNVKIA